MDPKDWLKQLRRAMAAKDWDALAELRRRTNEHFARNLDSDGLRAFYAATMQHGLDSEKAALLGNSDAGDFQAAIRKALAQVKTQLAQKPALKGVYFEYYYDGHKDGSNTGNFYLCSEYSATEDGWGAEFDQDGFVEGAELPDFFFFDADWEWDDESRSIAEEAANGRLLAAVLDEWKHSGLTGIPLGFANHDHEMVRTQAA